LQGPDRAYGQIRTATLENQLRPLASAVDPVAIEFAEFERARAYERASLAPATLRAYAQSWRDFEAWCSIRGTNTLSARPEDVGRYLAELADRGRKIATVWRQVSAIAWGPRRGGRRRSDGEFARAAAHRRHRAHPQCVA